MGCDASQNIVLSGSLGISGNYKRDPGNSPKKGSEACRVQFGETSMFQVTSTLGLDRPN